MKSRGLKVMALALLMSVAYSCNEEVDIPIPDLNPGTEEGGDITIYDIGEVVTFYSFPGYEEPQFRVYNTAVDIGGEGTIDLRLVGRYTPATVGSWWPYGGLDLRFNAQLIHMPDDNYDGGDNNPGYSFPVFLPVDALTGSTINGIWSPAFAPLEVLDESGALAGGLWSILPRFPVGISYIPTRSKVGSDFYYGWIECVASDYNDDDPSDFLLFSRFGISDTPGLRLRMGAE